jgi:hypothetical protein
MEKVMVVTAFESVGKWLATQAGVAKVFAWILRLVMGIYLFVSAAICIRLFTGVPIFAQLAVWVALSFPLPFGKRAPRAILNCAWYEALDCALLMLGSVYRLSGHASGIVVVGIMVYWALVLLATRRKT